MTSATEDRYRTLLGASSAIVEQPTVEAVLHSLHGVLSNIAAVHGTGLYLLSDDGESLQLSAVDQAPGDPAIPVGVRISRIGAVARVLDEQQPAYLADEAQEMLKHPELAPFACAVAGRSGYLLPVSTARKQYGVLAFGRMQGGDFSAEDLEVMRSLASHVAVALESAVARDRAELYQRELAKERDRLSLLLQINNHIISKLDIIELFRSASASIRSYFRNDFTGFWIIDEHSNKIECAMLDFPTGRGFLGEVAAADLTEDKLEKIRTRTFEILSADDIRNLPPPIAEHVRAESITNIAIVPLVRSNRALGVLAMGSRRPNLFAQQDLDLLSQISTQIALALENALAYGLLSASKNRLEEERLYLESEIRAEYNFEHIVGKSAALRKVLEQISIVAPTDSTVLLHGETGTGKELIARAIHSHSPRTDRTFVRLNCAAIPSGLVESELFGHEKGAFTGALMQKRGRFELADHGTLFLDEIGDINLELQPKLLRALQEHEFERLGSTKTIKVDVRLITATHRDLEGMIRNGQFREDLFYRLNVFPIEIPPLRERRDDIPLLVHYFVSQLARRMRKNIKAIPKEAMEALANAPWPGNIRELENFIERAVILTQGEELNVPLAELKKSSVQRIAPTSTFHETERQAIIDALKAASGKLSGKEGAAERLGLKRTTLQNKMRRLGITKADY